MLEDVDTLKSVTTRDAVFPENDFQAFFTRWYTVVALCTRSGLPSDVLEVMYKEIRSSHQEYAHFWPKTRVDNGRPTPRPGPNFGSTITVLYFFVTLDPFWEVGGVEFDQETRFAVSTAKGSKFQSRVALPARPPHPQPCPRGCVAPESGRLITPSHAFSLPCASQALHCSPLGRFFLTAYTTYGWVRILPLCAGL
jgi:hypothetical protein